MFRFAFVLTALAMLAGCRTSNTALKPAKSAEQYLEPPHGSRYDTPEPPREVMDRTGERTGGLADAPRSVVPGSGIGSGVNYGRGLNGH